MHPSDAILAADFAKVRLQSMGTAGQANREGPQSTHCCRSPDDAGSTAVDPKQPLVLLSGNQTLGPLATTVKWDEPPPD
jgi:hypothetical protein